MSVATWWGWFWRALEGGRRVVLNLVFLLVLVALLIAFWRSGAPALQNKTTLVLNLSGALVEQSSSDPRQAVLDQLGGKTAGQPTQLRDVLTALEAAAQDPKISSVLLELDEFDGAGLPALREVAQALERFKASGKPVVAWGMGFNQRQYYLAAHANEVFMHPMGVVFVQGFGGYQNYYGEALNRLGVKVELVRAGQFKSAGEVFTGTEPSPESVEAHSFLYNAMWTSYTQGVEKARKLPSGAVMEVINDLPAQLASAGGDAAQLALDKKWIDGLKTRDELRQLMATKGAATADGHSFRQVALEAYLPSLSSPKLGDAIGVVVAQGTIMDGQASAGTVGGASTAELIRQARLDNHIKAVVLRVNSPGGSPLGSELIRQELALTRAQGKPVVVSMGDVAASGGYWISMAADEVFADEATVTGSIGVFALLPHADKALNQWGLHTGGVTTTWLAAAGDPRRPVDPRFTEVLQKSIDHTYQDFITKAAQARKTTSTAMDAVAQGRVWTGAQAQERGLVDTVGGFYDALKSAAAKASLGTNKPRLVYIEPERSKFDRLLSLMGGTAAQAWASTSSSWGLRLPQPARQAEQELGALVQLMDGKQPLATLAHCFCGHY